jgi:hypothetical protein
MESGELCPINRRKDISFGQNGGVDTWHYRQHIPQPDGLVIRPRRDRGPVRTPGYCGNTRQMALKCMDELPAVRIPNLDGSVGP